MPCVTATVSRPARKQQQRSLQTKQKLLDAALEAFSQNGFNGTSTRDIAARAGVHHPLITYHFKNKDLLWRAAVSCVFDEFVRGHVEAAKQFGDDCPRARAAALIRNYVHYAARHPAMHKIVLQESGQSSARLDWLTEKYLKPVADMAKKQVAELQQYGIMPPGDPALIYNMIRASSGGLIALALEMKQSSGVDIDNDATLDELTDLIEQIYLPGNTEPRRTNLPDVAAAKLATNA